MTCGRTNQECFEWSDEFYWQRNSTKFGISFGEESHFGYTFFLGNYTFPLAITKWLTKVCCGNKVITLDARSDDVAEKAQRNSFVRSVFALAKGHHTVVYRLYFPTILSFLISFLIGIINIV